MKKNLVFVDWDDTLFPTNWIHSVDIDLDNPNSDMIKMFEELDTLITNMIINMISISNVLIVTNGTLSWVDKCLNVLPLFRTIVSNGTISVTSARDIFSEECDAEHWKTLTFKIFFNEHVSDLEGIYRILSFGDSYAEHNAVMELKHHNIVEGNKQKRIIGSIKFIRKPTLNQLTSQLNIIKLIHKDIIELELDNVYNLEEYISFDPHF